MMAYNNKKYYIDIVETKPSNAISIIETDCEVDFAPPLDYKEPEKPVAPFKGKEQGAHLLLFFSNPYCNFGAGLVLLSIFIFIFIS